MKKDVAAFRSALIQLVRERMPLSNVVDVKLTEVKINMLLSAIDTVHSPRLKQNILYISTLLDYFPNWRPWIPATDCKWVPVIICEETDSGLMIIDGVHRSMASIRTGMDTQFVFTIVFDKRFPPPCKLTSICNINLSDFPLENKFVGTNNSLFRPGEALQNDLKIWYSENN